MNYELNSHLITVTDSNKDSGLFSIPSEVMVRYVQGKLKLLAVANQDGSNLSVFICGDELNSVMSDALSHQRWVKGDLGAPPSCYYLGKRSTEEVEHYYDNTSLDDIQF